MRADRAGALLVAAMLVANPAVAADRPVCHGIAYDDALSTIASGTISGGRVYFLAGGDDKAGCPSADAACRLRAFLLEGNPVVYEQDAAPGGYLCASFIDAHGTETDGFVPAVAIRPTEPRPNWVGHWTRDTSARIDIVLKPDGSLDLSGEATWGTGGGTHVGEIAATLDPRKAVQGFGSKGDTQVAYDKADPNDCAVNMKQLGPYLLAIDNGLCGGVNVSFFGLYTRR